MQGVVRIPVTWKVSSTRNFLAKTHKLPAARLRIYLRRSPDEDWQEPEDHKEMFCYGVQDGSSLRLELLA